MSGSDVTESIHFVSIFLLSVSETGLRNGTSWSLTLGGLRQTSTIGTISFQKPNGSYSLKVGTVSGYDANLTTVPLVVSGQNVSASVSFAAANSGGGSQVWEIYAAIGAGVAVLIAAAIWIMRRGRDEEFTPLEPL